MSPAERQRRSLSVRHGHGRFGQMLVASFMLASCTTAQRSADVTPTPPLETPTTLPIPESPTIGPSPVIHLAVGFDHACLARDDGVHCWGKSNQCGQLGGGTTALSGSNPVRVTGIKDRVGSLALANGSSCALTEKGEPLCWGCITREEPGRIWMEKRRRPVPFEQFPKLIDDMYAAGGTKCALTFGELKCVGLDMRMSGGRERKPDDRVVEKYEAPVIDAAMEGSVYDPKRCVLLANNSVICGWSRLSRTESQPWPIETLAVSPVGLCVGFFGGQIRCGDFTLQKDNVVDLSIRGRDIDGGGRLGTGRGSYCAIADNGVMCWEVGTRPSVAVHGPYPVRDQTDRPLEDMLTVSVGVSFSCAAGPDSAYCWENQSKQGPIATKVEIGADDVKSQANHGCVPRSTWLQTVGDLTCIRNGTGDVSCWGREGARISRVLPRDVDGILIGANQLRFIMGDLIQSPPSLDWAKTATWMQITGKVTAFAGDRSAACFADLRGLHCWNQDSRGSARHPTEAELLLPPPVSSISVSEGLSSSGAGHVCAVRQGKVFCWGKNRWGQLGETSSPVTSSPGRQGRWGGRRKPAVVSRLPPKALSVAATDDGTCALMDGGTTRCWGGSYVSARSRAETEAWQFLPLDGFPASAVSIVSGNRHYCALLADGRVACWGGNELTQLGTGSTVSRREVVLVEGLASRATRIDAGHNHTCALLENGAVACWGDNRHGQLAPAAPAIDSALPLIVPPCDTGPDNH